MIKELIKAILSTKMETEEIKYELKGYKFTWDDKKYLSNIEKHKVNFKLAAEAYLDENALEYLRSKVDGEEVIKLIGKNNLNNLLVVIFVGRKLINNEQVIRIISARYALEKEIEDYEY